MTAPWFHIEQGQGRPLVLLHGIGMSHAAWQPVMHLLARERRVIAVDVAGFGQTPALTGAVSADALVDGLKQTLLSLGINEPVDIAGNSMGGWLALAAATHGLVRSVVAISPAGLSNASDAPRHIRPTFDSARLMAQRFPRLSETLIKFGLARSAFLAIPMSIRGYKIPSAAAIRSIRDFAHAPGFDATYDAIDRVKGLSELTMPITIAFGRLDFLLIQAMQSREWLPAQTLWLRPWSWGHVPMWDDPEGVAKLILTGTA
ncbi:MAG: alpha/beta hydrolase [Paraperlucidibaca sp.]